MKLLLPSRTAAWLGGKQRQGGMTQAQTGRKKNSEPPKPAFHIANQAVRLSANAGHLLAEDDSLRPGRNRTRLRAQSEHSKNTLLSVSLTV
jgi:hypothetical protein